MKTHWPATLLMAFRSVASTTTLSTMCGRRMWPRDCIAGVGLHVPGLKEVGCLSCQRAGNRAVNRLRAGHKEDAG